MDSNGTRFVLLDAEADFNLGDMCEWDRQHKAVTLARAESPRLPTLTRAEALQMWATAAPWVLDDHGQLATLSADRRAVHCTLTWPNPKWLILRAERDPIDLPGGVLEEQVLDAVDAPTGCVFVDLHLGGSGLLAAPYSDGANQHGVTLVHLRGRWQRRCALPFRPTRACVDGADRVWLVGADRLALVRGAPLPRPYIRQAARFEPEIVEPDPPRLHWDTALPADTSVLALAADADTLYLLAGGPGENPASGTGQSLWSRALDENAGASFNRHALPNTISWAVDLTALGEDRVLLIPPVAPDAKPMDSRDCPLVLLSDPTRLLAERWPRRGGASVRFVRHRDNLPRHLSHDGVHRMYRLAQARFESEGSLKPQIALDAGAGGTVWDTLYLEACIPRGCTIAISADASDAKKPDAELMPQPTPTWCPHLSELPFGANRAEHEPQRAGLYQVLLQRHQGQVRELRGRYLHLRIRLTGDGRHSPAIHAIRVWYPRFSWQQHYLPEHFQQQDTWRPDTSTGAANGADLRERVLALFKSVLTPIEERIAASEALLYPEAVPAALLPHLAAMLGTTVRPHWPETRQRRWLAALGLIQRRKGTLRSLTLALDVMTDGGVERGEVVPVELFRLRHTMATVLGVNMNDANHPLTLGTGQSGNSIVGDSLILSPEQAREVLALFAPDLARPGAEQAAVARSFDDHARRLTVVLHGAARALRGVIEEALPELVPAMVKWNVVVSDHPFVLGLSPLLQIDTYLEKQPAPGRLRLNRSRLGRGDLLHNPVALVPENVGTMGDIAARGGGP